MCAGTVVPPSQANEAQMISLGYELGKMHTTLRTLPASQLHWLPSKAYIQEEWEQNYKLAKAQKNSDHVLAALEQQQDILHRLDFSRFNLSPQVWAHWDMYVDNILFFGNQVSAILDFDRMRYVYPELDVARAILSGCIDEKGMNSFKLTAFMQGYREWFPLFRENDLNRSLQLLWTLESPCGA